MDHDGPVLAAVSSGVLEVEPLRHLEVQLDGSALPGPSEGVLQVEVDLRAVEGSIALVDHVVDVHGLQSVHESVGCVLPVLVGAHAVLRTGGELDVVLESEFAVHLVDEPDDALDLGLDHLRGHVDVRIVLGEAPDTEQAVEGTGLLVPVHESQLPVPDRQVPVGPGLGAVYQGAAGAVHRLDAVHLVVDGRGVHVVLVVVPVTGSEPEVLVQDHGGVDLLVAVPEMELPPVLDEGVLQGDPVGKEEREPGALLHDGEDAELLSEPAVVPLLGLLDHSEVLLQVLLGLPGGSVDPGEHLVVLVAAPVCSGEGGELERLDRLGVEGVGSCAEVDELPLLVEADGGVGGEVLDELDLVVLALRLQVVDGLLPGQGVGLDLEVLLDDLLHLGLELLEVLGGEATVLVEIVVEAVVDGGSDGQLGVRIEPFDGLGQNVRGGVPDDRKDVLRLLDTPVGIQSLHGIHLRPPRLRWGLNASPVTLGVIKPTSNAKSALHRTEAAFDPV